MKKSLSEENIYLLNRDEHKCISASNLKKISTVCVSKKINLVANAIYLPQTCGGSHNYIAWTPTAWGSNCGSPLTQPSSVLPSHSLFPFMSATETHQLSLDCCTHKHTLIRACSRLVTSAAEKSDAWATAYATMGVAEGGLIELGSSNYMLLRSRVCVCERASELTITRSALPCSLLCSATQLVILAPRSLWYNSHILHYWHILQVHLLCQHAVFRQSNVCLHMYVCEKILNLHLL